MMDPLHMCISLGPLAVYLLLMGMVNLSRRPFITSGARDTAALGVAISGFIVAGPMELFMPESAANVFGPWVWLLLISFYGLGLTLIVLLMRPRLIVYNVTSEQLRPLLAEVVQKLDKDARWAGDSLTLPHLGVTLHAETAGGMRNAQLVSAGPQQSFAGWRRLEWALIEALRESKGSPNPYGFSLVMFGLLMIGIITWYTVNYREVVQEAFFHMLRM